MPVTSQGVDALQAEQGVKPRAFVNDTRWRGFVEWASFLGLVVNAGRTLIPNPARAIRGVLPAVFGGVRELPQELFFTRLAEALPILDGGNYREQVEASVERPWRRMSIGELSPASSLALQQLRAVGISGWSRDPMRRRSDSWEGEAMKYGE